MRKIFPFILLSFFVISGCAPTRRYIRPVESPVYNEAVMINNTEYLPLLRFSNYYELDWGWDLVAQRIKLEKGKKNVILRTGSSLALVNGAERDLGCPVEYINGTAYIPLTSASYLTEKVFRLEEKRAAPIGKHRIKIVVIDPGHGGKDPGAVSRYGTREKNIVLDVSKRLKKYLEASGLKVYLTRNRDVFISLRKRPAFAERKKADLFISVHANAASGRRGRAARGFEVFYLSDATNDTARALAAAENASLKYEEAVTDNKGSHKDPTLCDLILSENRKESKDLAKYMASVTAEKLSMRKRGAKGARFAVLKGASMPAVLVEVGFLTNKSEESRLKQSSFREKIAKAIAQSILVYKNEYERKDGFSQ